MRTKILSTTITLLITTMAAVAIGQEPAQPGPEHEFLKKQEGTWETTMKMPGMPDSKGKAVYKMALGGLWLNSKFESDFGGTKFEGQGLDGYDVAKKKYVSIWVDSMITSPLIMEGDYDQAQKTLTMTGDMREPDGRSSKIKTKTVYKDEDSMEFTMYDSNDQELFSVSYRRSK